MLAEDDADRVLFLREASGQSLFRAAVCAEVSVVADCHPVIQSLGRCNSCHRKANRCQWADPDRSHRGLLFSCLAVFRFLALSPESRLVFWLFSDGQQHLRTGGLKQIPRGLFHKTRIGRTRALSEFPIPELPSEAILFGFPDCFPGLNISQSLIIQN